MWSCGEIHHGYTSTDITLGIRARPSQWPIMNQIRDLALIRDRRFPFTAQCRAFGLHQVDSHVE